MEGTASTSSSTASAEQNGNSDPNWVANLDIQTTMAAAIGAAAAQAKVAAENEEAEMRSIIASAVDIQIRKLDLLLAEFEKMRSQLQLERQQVCMCLFLCLCVRCLPTCLFSMNFFSAFLNEEAVPVVFLRLLGSSCRLRKLAEKSSRTS